MTTTANAIPARSAVAGVASDRTTNRALLAAGAAAGPVFTLVASAQVLLRDGFDLGRQPLSLLALGDLGWIQIAAFVGAGLLALAGAVGMRRTLPGGPARRWGAALVAAYGTGLIVAGVLVADPSMGWPAGAPEGPAATMSWHGIGHGVGAMLAFGSVTLACLVFARHDARSGRRAWAVFSLACALTFALLLAWPDQDSISVRMALGSTVVFAWLTAVCVDLLPSR